MIVNSNVYMVNIHHLVVLLAFSSSCHCFSMTLTVDKMGLDSGFFFLIFAVVQTVLPAYRVVDVWGRTIGIESSPETGSLTVT